VTHIVAAMLLGLTVIFEVPKVNYFNKSNNPYLDLRLYFEMLKAQNTLSN
jgi:hypothetical protein